MQIIEQLVIGKSNQRQCEDGIAVSDGFVAVIDGSTSKTKRRINPDLTNGKYCTELVSDFIVSMPKNISLDEFCDGVTALIDSKYEHFNVNMEFLRRHSENRLTASAVIYSSHLRQIWMVGDCQCLVNGILYENSKPQEAIAADKRSRFLKEKLSLGVSVDEIQIHDIGRDQILVNLVQDMARQNID